MSSVSTAEVCRGGLHGEKQRWTGTAKRLRPAAPATSSGEARISSVDPTDQRKHLLQVSHSSGVVTVLAASVREHQRPPGMALRMNRETMRQTTTEVSRAIHTVGR